MKVPRRYTTGGQDPFAAFTFAHRNSRIANPDGSLVFEMKDLLAPEHWSQVAVDVLAQKYFRKAGLPAATEPVAEAGVPEWLQCRRPVVGDAASGQETDARQVFRRLAGCWTYWGWKGGYFESEADAQAFFDEICHMLAAQAAAPNSPQWFNTGLHWAYGIEGPPQGHYYVEPQTGAVMPPRRPTNDLHPTRACRTGRSSPLRRVPSQSVRLSAVISWDCLSTMPQAVPASSASSTTVSNRCTACDW